MRRQFTISRVRQAVTTSWEFPLAWDEVDESPLAGPFSALEQRRLDTAIGCFPFARRTGDGRKAWRINSPGSGDVVAWVTSDGSLYVEGETTLNLIYAIYVHLSDTCPELVVEDRITSVVHNAPSLLRLVRRDEQNRALSAA